MPINTGNLDTELGYVIPNNTGTWESLTSWDTWTQWATQPANPLRWYIDPVDLEVEQTFNLKIQSVANGYVEYKIYTSNTGAFEGEETITHITQGQTDIPAFTGRYVWIEVYVYQTAGVNVLYGVEYAISQKPNYYSINNLNTASLEGTTGLRTIPMSTFNKSAINVQITPKEVQEYDVDMYVTNTPKSKTVIPRVISKSIPMIIGLVGIDNQPRDAVVDITIEYLPEGYMSGNNLLLR